MSIAINLTGTTVVIDGHTVTGWSDDADALMMPDEVELAQVQRGADGLMVASLTGIRGGEVQLKLLASSESAQFFGRLVTHMLNGGWRESSGTIRYANGVVTHLERGILTTAPLALTAGQGSVATRIFRFEFERIITNYDSGRYSSPTPVTV